MSMRAAFPLQIRIHSPLNGSRLHWSAVARRRREQRTSARCAALALLRPGALDAVKRGAHVQVTLTRVAPRKMDDDNLQAGFKSVRDGIADALRLDDGSERIKWVYAQRAGTRRDHTVTVDILIYGGDES